MNCSNEIFISGVSQGVNNEITLQVSLTVVHIFILTFLLISFIHYKPKFARTRVRGTNVLVLRYLYMLIFPFMSVLPLLTPVPCWVVFCLLVLMSAGLFLSLLASNITMILTLRLSLSTLKLGRTPPERVTEAEEAILHSQRGKQLLENYRLLWFGIGCMFMSSEEAQTNFTKESNLQVLLTIRLLMTNQGLAFFCFIFGSPFFLFALVICLSVETFRDGCSECPFGTWPNFIYSIVIGMGLLVFALVFAKKRRNLPDNFGIFQESRIDLVGVVFWYASILASFFVPFEYQFILFLGVYLGMEYVFFCRTLLQVYWGRQQEGSRSSRAKSTTTILKQSSNPEISYVSELDQTVPLPIAGLTGCVRLKEIMRNPELYQEFQRHLANEMASECLFFLTDVAEWIAMYHGIAKNASASRAKKIANTYLSSNGLYQINISDSMSREILKLVEEAEVKVNVFEKARKEIAFILEDGPVMRFNKSRFMDDMSQQMNGIIVDQVDNEH